MKNLIIVIYVAFPYIVAAQISFNGIVVDSKEKPIPYASIGYFNNHVGSISDSNGHFSITKIYGDSIKVSSIGYKPTIIKILNQTNYIRIELQEEYAYLNDVSVRSRSKTTEEVVLGHSKSKNDFLGGYGKQVQFATYIPNDKKIRGYIDEIKFRLDRYKKTTYLLRIRLFTKNEFTQLPEEDLLFDANIINSKELKQNNTFSLRNKAIEFPKEGVFVSFEWLPQIGITKEEEKTPMLVGNMNADKNYTYFNYKEIQWHPSKSKSLIRDGYCVPNISITVSY